MLEVICNDEGVIKTIRYKEEYIKETRNFFVGLLTVLLIVDIILFIGYFIDDEAFPLHVPIIIGCACLIVIILFIASYNDIKNFYLNFNEEGICFKCRGKERSIRYSELTVCGLIRRAGGTSWGSFFDNHTEKESDSQSIFVFTAKENPQLKKIVWHMRTSRGVCHGYYKDIFCVSAYWTSSLFSKCFDTIKHYCSNFSVQMIDTVREDLKR